MKRLLLVLLFIVLCGQGDPAQALPSVCRQMGCQRAGDGVALFSHRARGDANASSVGHPVASASRDDTTVTPGCPSNDPNVSGGYDMACGYMTDFCATVGETGSWLVWVWSRRVRSGERWVKSGFACRSPQQVQAASPGVSRALVARAFARVRFAHPRVHVQPEGDVTLVNLATYFAVEWPVQGFEPGEVAQVVLLGRVVRLRPRAVSYTYWFGDGAGAGPTSDAGGPFPVGQVRHVYRRTGQVPVRVDVAYSGEYSLSGGPWQSIDLTVPVTGDPHPVQVKQARARLEPRPR